MPTLMSLAGGNTDRRTTEAEFKLGTPSLADDNTTWVYVQAAAAVAAAAVVILATDFTITTGAGDYTAETAFEDGEYGWVQQTASPL